MMLMLAGGCQNVRFWILLNGDEHNGCRNYQEYLNLWLNGSRICINIKLSNYHWCLLLLYLGLPAPWKLVVARDVAEKLLTVLENWLWWEVVDCRCEFGFIITIAVGYITNKLFVFAYIYRTIGHLRGPGEVCTAWLFCQRLAVEKSNKNRLLYISGSLVRYRHPIPHWKLVNSLGVTATFWSAW